MDSLVAMAVVTFGFSSFGGTIFRLKKCFVVTLQIGSKIMTTQFTAALSMLAGAGGRHP
jgi:hypothetical protein